MLVLPTRGQALSPSWLHQLGVAGDGFAEAAQVANLFEEVEAVIIDNAALSQGDTTIRAPHVRHTQQREQEGRSRVLSWLHSLGVACTGYMVEKRNKR